MENQVPELKVEVTEKAEAAVPTLDVTPTLELEKTPAQKKAEPAGPDINNLSPAEQKAVHEAAEKIDLTDSNLVLQYGVAAQKNVADFSEAALSSVRTKDLGEVGNMISGLVVELKGFNAAEEKKGFLGLFKKAGTSIETLKARYDKASVNVDKIARQLEEHQVTLMKDVAVLDQMYNKNLDYYKQLTMYILAGKERLERERTTTLVELQEKAKQTGLAEDAQRANDFEAMCTRFEKKLYDLEVTRMVSIQMAPQIRLLQNNDNLMNEKIQTSIVNTIPLWKSQMVLALGLDHTQKAMEAQKAVTDLTNELLKKNAEQLHLATVATAKESERAVVDLETLQYTNERLITTLDDVMRIQQEGKEKRAAAETELRRIEGELKNKLLEVRTGAAGQIQ